MRERESGTNSHKNYLMEVVVTRAQPSVATCCQDQVELLSYQHDCVNKLNNELI